MLPGVRHITAFIIKFSFGGFIYVYFTDVSNVRSLPDLSDGIALSLLITYGAITLPTIIYDRAERLFKWFFVTHHE